MCVRAMGMLVGALVALECGGTPGDRPTDPRATDNSRTTQGAAAIATAEAELVESLQRTIERLVEADDFSGVVLVSRQGRPLLERAVGRADRERQRANTLDTPFALASVSKMFTAVVVAQLAEQGLISVDATVGSLLPAYPRLQQLELLDPGRDHRASLGATLHRGRRGTHFSGG